MMQSTVLRLDSSDVYDYTPQPIYESRVMRRSAVALRSQHAAPERRVVDSIVQVDDSRVFSSRPDVVVRRSYRPSSIYREEPKYNQINRTYTSEVHVSRPLSRSVHRTGELYYYDEQGRRVYTQENTYATPYTDTFVQTMGPQYVERRSIAPLSISRPRLSHVTYSRRSVPRMSISHTQPLASSMTRSRIALESYNSYSDIITAPTETRVYQSVLPVERKPRYSTYIVHAPRSSRRVLVEPTSQLISSRVLRLAH